MATLNQLLENTMTNTNHKEDQARIKTNFAKLDEVAENNAIISKLEAHIMNSRQATTLFKFKAEQVLDESKIVVQNIEHKSSGFIAKRLVATLEKQGHLKQYDPEDASNEYCYESQIDVRLIAMLGVQLSGLIVHMDKPMDLDVIADTTYAYKMFRNIARANRTIPGAFDDANDVKAFWVNKVKRGIRLAIDAKLIDQDDDGLITRSKVYISSCISRKSIAHQTNPITDDTRRKERVKNKMQPRKDGTSAKVREALTFIEGQGQCVNTSLLDVVNKFMIDCNEFNIELPEAIQDSLHVIEGCNELRSYNVLYSEYFQDLRGRMYQFAHGGPNPQSSDLARALCYHTEENIVYKTDEACYNLFMNELVNEVADCEYATLPQVLTWVAQNPLDAIKEYHRHGSDLSGVKKFWTYLTLAQDWFNFETVGYTDCRIGFGPDAKCSGAQLLAILAGCEKMGKACGLTNEDKGDDPYELSTQEVIKLQTNSKRPEFRNALLLTRAEIKTPFMAIQYGGGAGVPATSPKFIKAMNRIGIPVEMRHEFCAKVVKKGIINALGEKINALIEGLQKAAKLMQVETGRDYFTYKHVDGNTCTKRGEAKVRMTNNHFKINFGERDNAIIFGATEEAKGGEQGWKVESQTIGNLQRENFSYYFPVHFIQGLDSVVAREIALQVKKRGLKGFTTIHDQFRVCLRDAPKMMNAVADAYREIFIKNNPLKRLESQMKGNKVQTLNPLEEVQQIVTEEVLTSPKAYYFE